MIHLILHWLGLDSASGPAYLAWSGVGSDIGELTLAAGLIAFLRHRNCHVKGCWRLGRHPVAGGQFAVCRKHHPDREVRNGLRLQDLHGAHYAHLRGLHHPTPPPPGGSP